MNKRKMLILGFIPLMMLLPIGHSQALFVSPNLDSCIKTKVLLASMAMGLNAYLHKLNNAGLVDNITTAIENCVSNEPQQYPNQQVQPQQQGQPLYNPNQVIACLNHILVDSIVKAGTTGSLTLRNNTNGTVTAGLNQSFIQNATNTLDSCIVPIRQ